MTGDKLKTILRQTGLSMAEISRRLGVIPQNLDVYLRSNDIKTGLLERLAEILDKDISWFYSGEPFGVQSSSISVNMNDENAALVAQLREKDEQISRLMGIIEAMQGIGQTKKGIA